MSGIVMDVGIGTILAPMGSAVHDQVGSKVMCDHHTLSPPHNLGKSEFDLG